MSRSTSEPQGLKSAGRIWSACVGGSFLKSMGKAFIMAFRDDRAKGKAGAEGEA